MLSLPRFSAWYATPWICVLVFLACSDDDGGPQMDVSEDVVEADTATQDAEVELDLESDAATLDDESDDRTDQDLVPAPSPVTEPGQYGVGFDEWEITYSREGSEEERSLRVVFWYPTVDESGPPAVYAHFFRRPAIFLQADIAENGPYPVLVFSHGNGGFAEQSYFFTEFLASHGWIVVSPDHKGNTAFDMSLPTHELLDLRPQDVSAVIDALESLPSEHTLYGQQADELAVSGHSFGGYTTLVLTGATFDVDLIDTECDGVDSDYCDFWRSDGVRERFVAGFSDPRIDLGIPMAPANWLIGDTAAVTTPTLLFTGALDGSTPNAEHGDPIWQNLDGSDDMRVDLETGGHFTFSNACELVPAIAEGDGCGEEFISAEGAYYVINAYSLAFLRSRFWGDVAATAFVEDVANPLDPTAVLSHKD